MFFDRERRLQNKIAKLEREKELQERLEALNEEMRKTQKNKLLLYYCYT